MKNLYRHILIILAITIITCGITNGQPNQNSSLASIQNYPNPFNPSTQIQFVLLQDAEVTVKVFNILGREINTIVENKTYSAGQHAAEWDGKDKNGQLVPSGMYLYQVQAGNSVLTKKMSLLK